MVRFGGPRGPKDQRRPAQPPPAHLPCPLPPALSTGAGLALAERLARTGVRCAQVPATVATPSFVRRAHALGLQVHAWTVNSPAVMRRLLDTGVDGIMTDQTVALRDILISRGEWHPRPC
jgi:glycerophosphoryl diester phosphodiesterase